MQKHWKCVDLNLFWTKNVIEVRRSSWLSIFLSLSLMVLHLCVCLSLGSPFSISLPPYVGRSSWFSISLPPGFLPPFIRRSSWILILHLFLLSLSLSPPHTPNVGRLLVLHLSPPQLPPSLPILGDPLGSRYSICLYLSLSLPCSRCWETLGSSPLSLSLSPQ